MSYKPGELTKIADNARKKSEKGFKQQSSGNIQKIELVESFTYRFHDNTLEYETRDGGFQEIHITLNTIEANGDAPVRFKYRSFGDIVGDKITLEVSMPSDIDRMFAEPVTMTLLIDREGLSLDMQYIESFGE